jgi:hypothetical protein
MRMRVFCYPVTESHWHCDLLHLRKLFEFVSVIAQISNSMCASLDMKSAQSGFDEQNKIHLTLRLASARTG